MSARIIVADVMAGLAELEAGSVQCCVTSPPYWGLRDYGVAGQIGLERTSSEFVDVMVRVFAEVRRVMRVDGTLWLNLGDCYNAFNGGSGPGGTLDHPLNARNEQRPMLESGYGLREPALKPKDLVGIPWRVALALQADGWWLRSDIVWSKPNPMPESTKDRPTKAHEYLFLMAAAERYYYDHEAIAEPRASAHPVERDSHGNVPADRTTRNQRSVWTIATAPFAEAHFATFPPELPRRCILAGTSERGACSACGAPWRRLVDVGYDNPGNRTTNGPRSTERRHETAGFGQRLERRATTTGWKASCECDAPARPCLVLDPFAGAGTTGLVADQLGRDFVGIELNPDYAALAERRLRGDSPLFAEVTVDSGGA